MSEKRRILTGITTSGTPHLGNYVGAIRPAIAASRRDGAEAYFFLADYHALIKCQEPERVQRSTLEIAATWLACGLDIERVFFYRQSDIPEIPELTWLLTCVTAKGLLNRAHAYKAAVDQNTAQGEDADAGINAGLYMYPVLMAADILLFNAHEVPVGKDQIQHIEMARDIGQRFNHLYGAAFRNATGTSEEPFVLPEAVVDESVATLPGLDGRKMSKSYNNIIPLWLPEKQLRKAILGIVTDSRLPGEPKDPDTSHLFTLYQAFATAEETAAMRQAYVEGIGWGDAKEKLFQRVNTELAEMRERYETLITRPGEVEAALQQGAAKARQLCQFRINHLRSTVGLRDLARIDHKSRAQSISSTDSKLARIVTFKDKESGDLYFRLVTAEGEQLLLSRSFSDSKQLGEVRQKFADADSAALEFVFNADGLDFAVTLGGQVFAESPGFVSSVERDKAMARLRMELEKLTAAKQQ